MNAEMIKILLFAAVSLWIVYLSRKSLFIIGSHGFYRFFAWETITALVLVNFRSWFINPLSTFQIISWIFLCGSLIVLGLGFFSAAYGKQTGQPAGRRDFAGIRKNFNSGNFRNIPLHSSSAVCFTSLSCMGSISQGYNMVFDFPDGNSHAVSGRNCKSG